MSSRTSFALATATLLTMALAWPGCGNSDTSTGGNSPQEAGASSSSGSGSGGSSGAGSSSGGSGSGGSSGSSSGGGSGGSSGGSSGGGSGSGSGSSSGSSSGGTDGGATCPTVPCTGGQTCCADLSTDMPYCAASCASNDTIQCEGPANCGGSTPDCCATDVLDGMDAGQSFPHCTTASLTTKCVAKCVSNIQVSCTATEILHVCNAGSDCGGDTSNPNCCLVAGYHVCVSTLLKTLGGLTCVP